MTERATHQQRQQPLPPPCSIEVEALWGPQVHGCGTDFDLTLLFQEVVLFIGPLAIVICLATVRLWQLVSCEAIVASPLLHRLKMGSYVLLTLLQAALLAVQVSLRASLTRATIAASCLGIVGALILLVTSHLEHDRSVRPSTYLILYFGFSTVADALRARTLWSMPRDNAPVAAILTAFCACKFVLFVLERGRKMVRSGIRQPTTDEQADIVSRLFLWWLLPLFRLGKVKPTLTPETLPDIELRLTIAGDVRPGAESSEASGDGSDLSKSSIFVHLFAVRGWLLLSGIPPRLCYMGFLFAQPFLVQRATDWLSAPLDANTYKAGGGLIAAYLIVYVGLGITQAFYRQCTARAITAIRADLVSKIYGHSLRLSASSSAQDAASTLMSADVERFAAGSRNMHECWACIIELGLGLWILEQQLGVATAAVGGLTITFVGLTSLVVGAAGRRQNEWLKSMETRIVGTTQALKVMKGIKMTGAASTIRRGLLGLRKAEIRKMRRFRHILLVVLWAMWIPVIMAPIVGFTFYNVAIGPKSGSILTPARVYQCLTILNLFGNDIATLLESSVNLVTAGASLLRIQAFLLGKNTHQDKRMLLSSCQVPSDDDDDDRALLPSPRVLPNNAIRLQRTRQSLSHAPTALRLTQACAGWGTDGPLIVHNVNLEVSSPNVVAVVGPTGSGKTTLLQLLLGETECADGVVAISTRHIGYCSQTPWLTHASIRDNIVGSDKFEESWYNTVIHATALQQDIDMIALSDSTIVGNAGSSLSGGQKKRIALARAVYTRAPVLILDDPLNGLDGRTETAVLEALLGPQGLLRKQETLVIWATSTVKQARLADRVISLTDSGNVRKRDSLLRADNRTDASRGDDESDGEDGSADVDTGPLNDVEVVEGIVVGQDPTSKDDILAPAKDPAAYRYYIGGGGKRKFLVFIAIIAVFVVGTTFSQVWAVRWAENNVIDPYHLQGYYIGIYFAVGAIQLIAWTFAALFFIMAIAEKAADRCHVALLDTVLSAPMSFFDSTAVGKTINRFSQDLQLIDTELPYNMMGTVTQFLVAVGQCGIIIYGSPWSGLAIPVVAVAVYWLQRTYLPTSRQLRLLEIEAKAPLFSHFLETLSGLATIRALRWTAAYAHKNQAAVTASQKPFYLLFSAQNWLNLVLDLITAGLAVTIMCVGVATGSQANSTLGLALFSAASFGGSAKNVIQHWTQLEISMGAMERVLAFTTETASEKQEHAGSQTAAVTSDSKVWFGKGRITFGNVSARYTPSLPLVIHNISFDIQPGQRYAICGRTGSGKSTLLATLLRLIPLDDGEIWVDDADISKINPDQVRCRFITLPQDPVLIGGTVRHNMQLYEPNYEDQEMIAALEAFGLWDTMLQKGGLDIEMNEELLSHGQRQLFCFARSTLQKGNVVILDEPSSQSDLVTEQKIEMAIRERFERHTVLCVAHKLSTILSFDTVIVMDAGSIAESGSPRALLQDRTSLFSTLMQSQREQDEQV
ncbi:P-loop containing nucleoside triphosphate hydrolase protein [Xylariales sp. AK1849]|nr:P-loop containing nucleoside triphosphate hydrolase protein [Xylariales sp. AK1849]